MKTRGEGWRRLSARHCEERSDAAIHLWPPIDGLLRFARNDEAEGEGDTMRHSFP